VLVHFEKEERHEGTSNKSVDSFENARVKDQEWSLVGLHRG
jgi:hypothetical protein